MAYRFGAFTLDERVFELRRGGQVVPLRAQAFEALHYLLRERDRVVRKRELFDRIWHGRAVSENALNQCISDIRRALGEGGGAQQLLKTVHGRGFRFVAEVSETDDRPPDSGAAEGQGSGFESLELTLRGIEHFKRGGCEHNQLAIRCLERAADYEPGDLSAVSHLGRAHYRNIYYLWVDDWASEVSGLARAADRCLRIDPAHPAGFMLSALRSMLEGNAEQSLGSMRKLLTRHSSWELRCLLGQILALCGRAGESIHCLKQALGGVPRLSSAELWMGLAMSYFDAGAYAKSRECADRAVVLSPPLISSQLCIAAASGLLGDPERASAAVARINGRYRDFSSSPFRGMLSSSPPELQKRFLGGLERAGLG
jgi:DNA-binding winged helix-turn-helix (wHTH) protein